MRLFLVLAFALPISAAEIGSPVPCEQQGNRPPKCEHCGAACVCGECGCAQGRFPVPPKAPAPAAPTPVPTWQLWEVRYPSGYVRYEWRLIVIPGTAPTPAAVAPPTAYTPATYCTTGQACTTGR